MSVKFEENCYFSTFQNHNFNPNRLIENEAKTHLQFHYGHVTYSQFYEEYALWSHEKDNHFNQKIQAIPAALWIAAQTIYHVAKALLIGIPKALFGDGNYLQVHFFYVVRDFQELFGRIISIFHECFGLYLIQESQFQKTCYDCFLAPSKQGMNLATQENDPLPWSVQNLPEASIKKQQSDIPSEIDVESEEELLVQSGPKQQSDTHSEIDVESEEESLVQLDPKQSVTYSEIDVESEEESLVQSVPKRQIETQSKVDVEAKDALLAQSAEKYFREGDFINAYKTIKKIRFDDPTKEAFLAKLAEEHFKRGDLNTAREIIKQIWYDSPARKSFLTKLTEECFKKDDLLTAHEIIKDIWNDNEARKELLTKLAEEYLKRGELEKGYNVAKEIPRSDETTQLLFIKFAQAFYTAGSQADVLEVIKDIVKRDMTKITLQKEKKGSEWTTFIAKLNSFASLFAEESYTQIEIKLKDDNQQEALNCIKEAIAIREEDFLLALAQV